MEATAVQLLKRAIDLEKQSKYQAALICYQEGIDALLEVLKSK